MLVQGWELSEARNTLTFTLRSVKRFYRANGRFPANGQELAHWNNGYGIDQASFCQMSAERQLEWMAVGMSPVTGDFFPSFTQDIWSAGGVYLQQFASMDELDQFYSTHPNLTRVGAWDKAKEVWLVKAFGDTPGEVVMELPIYFSNMDLPADKLNPALKTR
jgi:hypothetical protein